MQTQWIISSACTNFISDTNVTRHFEHVPWSSLSDCVHTRSKRKMKMQRRKHSGCQIQDTCFCMLQCDAFFVEHFASAQCHNPLQFSLSVVAFCSQSQMMENEWYIGKFTTVTFNRLLKCPFFFTNSLEQRMNSAVPLFSTGGKKNDAKHKREHCAVVSIMQ